MYLSKLKISICVCVGGVIKGSERSIPESELVYQISICNTIAFILIFVSGIVQFKHDICPN